MLELSGIDLLWRPVKLGPGIARSKGRFSHGSNVRDRPRPVFERWSRTDAADHRKGYSEQGRRLFVGGLPCMGGQSSVDAEVRNLFKRF